MRPETTPDITFDSFSSFIMVMKTINNGLLKGRERHYCYINDLTPYYYVDLYSSSSITPFSCPVFNGDTLTRKLLTASSLYMCLLKQNPRHGPEGVCR